MAISKDNKKIVVVVSDSEYELYNRFCEIHNKGVKHLCLKDVKYLSLSKLGKYALDSFVIDLINDEKNFNLYKGVLSEKC